MVASWPPTSGATRISVVRTTPAMVGGGSGRKRRYPPTPAATRTPLSTTIRLRASAMGAPPLDQGCRHDGEHEVDERKDPQPKPVTRNLPQACAQLVDADDAVDREIGGEDGPDGQHRLGDPFIGPGEAGQEELRQAEADKDERRRLRALEPEARCLAHEARCENERRGERE